jgi:hypothetical protein
MMGEDPHKSILPAEAGSDPAPQVAAGLGNSTATPTGEQESPKERACVRFPGLRRKAPPPPPYIHIDESLNLVGVKFLPNRWCIGPGWDFHPFQYVKSKKAFFTYSLEKSSKGTWRLEPKKLPSRNAKRELKACHRTYRDARRHLIRALGSQTVKAFKLRPDGRISPISDRRNGLWTVQLRSVFYIGYGHDKHGRYRVLVDQDTLEDWLNCDRQGRGAKLSKYELKAMLEALGPLLAERANIQGYTLRKRILKKAVQKVLAEEGQKISEHAIEQYLWKHGSLKAAQKAGRRRDSKEAFEDDLKEVKLIISQHFRNVQAQRT